MQTPPRALLPLCLTSLTLLLGACGTTAPTEADPYAGADAPWVYTAPDAVLAAQSLTPGTNSLTYEKMLEASNGWGPIELNRSNGEQGAGDGRTLTIAGQTFSRGFGVHASSAATFSLAGTGATCNRLRIGMGIDDEVRGRGSVTFLIYLDGAIAYSSGTMRGQGAGRLKWADLNIAGKQKLKLVVTDAGDGKSYDHADWVMPQVFCQATAAQPGLSFGQSSVDIFHKHHATLNATFRGINGAVNLRLVPPADFSYGPYAPGGARPIVLETTTATLSGSERTVPLRLAAPGLPDEQNEKTGDYQRLSYPYTLIASQNGRDVASATVTINEKLLTLQPSVEFPSGPVLSGVPTVVVVAMKVTPGLNAVRPVHIDSVMGDACGEFTPVGTTYSENGLLKQRYAVSCAVLDDSQDVKLYVGVDDISGYREWWYWSNETSFTVNHVP